MLGELIVREDATFVGTLDSTHLYFDALGGAGGTSDGYLEYWDHYYTALFATAAAQQATAQLDHPLALGATRLHDRARAARRRRRRRVREGARVRALRDLRHRDRAVARLAGAPR